MEENNTLTCDESIGKILNEHLNMNGNRILSDIVVEKIKKININLDVGFSFFNNLAPLTTPSAVPIS